NSVLKQCFRYMDGETSTDKLIRKVKLKTNVSEMAIRKELRRIFAALEPGGMVCLSLPMVRIPGH
ncbi:MAG: hypothetical protein V2I45_08960, partial [Halieaceae bacterium]|nr:hypothetical protein [Halieaceae bacterium]